MAQSPRSVGRLLVGRIGRTRLLVILSMVGPGLIAANAGNDAGGITTWSVIGSRYGYSMVWLLVVLTPVLAIVQEMNARVGVVTGRGLAALIRENFSLQRDGPRHPRHRDRQLRHHRGGVLGHRRGEQPVRTCRPTWPCRWLAVGRLVPRSRAARTARSSACCWRSASCSSPTSSPASWRARTGRPRRTASIPHVQFDSLWLFTVIAAVGTTLTPWGQFFIQAAVVDKSVSLKQYVYTKYEIYVGSVIMTSIDFFIVVACAATLYKEGIVVQSAQEAAMALEPFLGAAAKYLFGRRPAERLDPGRRRPAAGHRLRRLRGVRLRVRSGQRIPRSAGVQRHHHLPAVRAGRRGHHPRPAAGERHPRRPDAERRAAAGDPGVHPEHGEQPAGHGGARQRTAVRNVIAWSFSFVAHRA